MTLILFILLTYFHKDPFDLRWSICAKDGSVCYDNVRLFHHYKNTGGCTVIEYEKKGKTIREWICKPIEIIKSPYLENK